MSANESLVTTPIYTTGLLAVPVDSDTCAWIEMMRARPGGFGVRDHARPGIDITIKDIGKKGLPDGEYVYVRSSINRDAWAAMIRRAKAAGDCYALVQEHEIEAPSAGGWRELVAPYWMEYHPR